MQLYPTLSRFTHNDHYLYIYKSSIKMSFNKLQVNLDTIR